MMWFEILTAAIALVVILVILKILRRQDKTSLNIKGKYVLITGCDSGFGRATAIQLDKMGARVLATCLTRKGEESLTSVTSDRLKTFQMDVTSSQQIKNVFGKVKELLEGEGKLNELCNLLLKTVTL